MGPHRRGMKPGSANPDSGVDDELDAEIEAHLEMRAEAFVAQGMEPEAARSEALRRFGGDKGARRALVTTARRTHRRHTLRRLWDQTAADARFTWRRTRKSPGFAAVAVVIFAASVGLTTTMFNLVDNVLLRPLAFPEPDRLVALWSVGEGGAFPWVSMSNWMDWRAESPSLISTALYSTARVTVATEADAFHAPASRVAGPFFQTLGSSFVAGRGFTEEEAQASAPLVVLSEGFWTRVLGGGPRLDGAEVTVDGRRMGVVGVIPDEQALPQGADVWVPMPHRPGAGAVRNNINFQAVARLQPEASLEQARTELDVVAERIRVSDPAGIYSWGVGVRPLRDVLVGDARSYLVMLMVAVAFLLVVACANLAGLSLAHARQRTQESAVHLALGASRGRLIRRVVTEHVLLGLIGGGIGVALAWSATGYVMRRAGEVIPRAAEVDFDGRVAVFGILAAVLAGVLAGTAPAIRASRDQLSTLLSGARGGIGGGRGLPGAAMVATEVGLALTLLVAGGLLLRSFQAVISRDLGFDARGVMTADVSLVGSSFDSDSRWVDFWDAVTDRLRQLPGVEAVAVANSIPTTDGGRGFIDLEGQEGADIGAGYWVVSDGYFDVLDIPVLAGRVFGDNDQAGTERVAVVNQAMAERYWPNESAIGKRVRARSMESHLSPAGIAPWLTVVGVVGDALQYGHEDEVGADMFVLHRQVPYFTRSMFLTVESRLGSVVPAQTIRQAVHDVDPGVAIAMSSLDSRLSSLTGERRLVMSGLGLFAGAALLLVCLGIYGLMSFAAEARTREMAVRVALGAERGELTRLMLTSALQVVGVGAFVGLFGAWAFSRLLDGFLVDVGAADPVSYGAAVLLLSVVAVAAALGPSLRAARQDPLEALRDSA